jgi:hypothetical protein
VLRDAVQAAADRTTVAAVVMFEWTMHKSGAPCEFCGFDRCISRLG